MNQPVVIALFFAASITAGGGAAMGAESEANSDSGRWLGFRGDSSSAAAAGPQRIELGDQGNLAWQLTMPGRSVAGPIVVRDLVITTSSGGQTGEVLYVSAVDLATGQLRWEQKFRATGRPFCHPTSANAAPTPTSDGQRVFAFFSSNDLACLSLAGELLWYRGLGFDYPQAGNDVGMASSPLVAEGTVIVQIEAQGDSFAAGIDAQTGQNLWRIDRPKTSNWSSPVAIQRPDERTEVVLQSSDNVIAIDPRSGRQVWETGEAGANISSPTATGELLLVPGKELVALNYARSAATPEVSWRDRKLVPRNSSVVADGDRVYALKGSVLVAAELDDGEVVWQQRFSGLGSSWATPVVAAGKLYVVDQEGVGMIIADRGDRAEPIGQFELGEAVLASPALADGRLIIRGERTLFCFH